MSEKSDKIMYSSPEAARYQTGISGWVSAKGNFFGTQEHRARYDGCTHKECESEGCGEVIPNIVYTICEKCRAAKKAEAYAALPVIEWDGKTPLALYDSDAYFYDEDDIVYFCEEHDTKPSADTMMR